MRWLTQTFAVTMLGLKTIPQRLASSTVAVVGIAGVVIVFVSVLSIAEGFKAAMTSAGSPMRAMVMRSGADSEMTSGILGDAADIIKQAPGIQRVGGVAIASAELYVIIDRDKKSTGTPANVPVRGVEPTALQVRDEVKIIDGRMLTFGTNEVVVGRATSRQFAGLDVGSQIKAGQLELKVVGIFDAKGSVAETEIWADAHTIQGAYRRNNSYQSVLVRLESPASFDTVRDWLTTNPQLNVQVKRESDYYDAQSTTFTRLIRTVGYGIAGLMATGAIFGAMLTMYTAVSTRTREIATLRALGFNTMPVLFSVFLESMTLGVVGGLIGGGVAYLAFNGFQTSTLNWQTFSQVAFAFKVTFKLLVSGLIWALVMGFIGALLPAVRAARLPISVALREL